MDGSKGRRTATGISFSRGGCIITLREQNYHDRSIRCCSRLGCSASLYAMKGTQVGKQDRASFHSGPCPSLSANGFRKPQRGQRSSCSREEANVAEIRNTRRDSDKPKSGRRFTGIKDSDSNRRVENKKDLHSVPLSPLVGSAKLRCSSDSATGGVGSSRMKLRSITSKEAARQSRYRYIENSSASGSTSMSHGDASHDMASRSEVFGVENPRGTDISNVLAPECSSADSRSSRADNNLRMRSLKRGSSSFRGRGRVPSLNGSNSGTSDLSVSLPEHLISYQATRGSRNQSTNKVVVSVRTRQPPRGDTRIRPVGQVDESILAPMPLTVTQQSQCESGAIPQSSSRSSADFHHFYQNVHGDPGTSTQIAPRRQIHESAANRLHIFDALLQDRDGYPHLNMGGVAEVLLALERIEQDEGLTHEQLLALGNHLSLDSRSFHDQYRDMRMDIDNMSYEDLLALEEKMGTVSTALTEEALSRCLKRSPYMSASLISGISGRDEDEVKCSICQEEFVMEDEVGELVCKHTYHAACIRRWLQLKNWCPICKASLL
ncbi:uncharacterized protein LOC135634303 [Musa acuminata AAA Group]|uniref:uncharacterized protein LOC135634303 n=1 Tax=Musa acuminata AAA Group TaxID=214697 RepID=UPI0031DE3C68